MGTEIRNVQVLRVIDGDTIVVDIFGCEETLRLLCLDTEESRDGGSKPKTNAGVAAKEFAREFFSERDGSFSRINVEFDTDEPVDVCLSRRRGSFGRLLCYVWKDGLNYNLETVARGFSPYFLKYGRSRIYDKELLDAERVSQKSRLMIWDENTNAGGKKRDYDQLIPWWYVRASIVDRFRLACMERDILSVKSDYEKIVALAKKREEAALFIDLQGEFGLTRSGSGAFLKTGSHLRPFNIWMPDVDDLSNLDKMQLIHSRYIKQKRNYGCISGKLSIWGDVPQFHMDDIDEICDI